MQNIRFLELMTFQGVYFMFIERFCDKIMQQSRGHFEISPCILASFLSRKDIMLACFVWHMCVQACVHKCVLCMPLSWLHCITSKCNESCFSSHCLKTSSSLIITYFINIDCPLCTNHVFSSVQVKRRRHILAVLGPLCIQI